MVEYGSFLFGKFGLFCSRLGVDVALSLRQVSVSEVAPVTTTLYHYQVVVKGLKVVLCVAKSIVFKERKSVVRCLGAKYCQGSQGFSSWLNIKSWKSNIVSVKTKISRQPSCRIMFLSPRSESPMMNPLPPRG